VVKGYTTYGELVEPVVAGFVRSVSAATTFVVPHDAVDAITRTAFVDAVPLVVHASCRSQLAVSVHSVAWASGP
jgi:hypothetical protein